MSPPPPPEISLAADWPPAAPNPLPPLGPRRRSPWPGPGDPRETRGRLLRFVGPGVLVAVGYMDPGNWATDLAGGSAYGYSLLWVVLFSGLVAMFLQVLAARLGIASGLDLAQACRANASRPSAIAQWLLCEIAICACDLAEVIGTAIALNLLFGLPLAWGVALTVLDVLVILVLQRHGFRPLEAVVAGLVAVVFGCFAINLVLAQPAWGDVAAGFVPTARTLADPGMLYLAIGIVGATVMPHNLYLHSSVVQQRAAEIRTAGKRRAMGYATVDIVAALCLALFINAAILITAAAVFHEKGYTEIAELQDAWKLLGPLTGSTIASFLFAFALLAAGQSSTLTATMAGQIVMEGFVKLRMAPWARRLLTRGLAIVPALAITLTQGEEGLGRLLVFSQVILSLQLPFAMVPLIRFTSSRRLMGEFANSRRVTVIAGFAAALIIGLNALLLWRTVAA